MHRYTWQCWKVNWLVISGIIGPVHTGTGERAGVCICVCTPHWSLYRPSVFSSSHLVTGSSRPMTLIRNLQQLTEDGWIGRSSSYPYTLAINRFSIKKNPIAHRNIILWWNTYYQAYLHRFGHSSYGSSLQLKTEACRGSRTIISYSFINP